MSPNLNVSYPAIPTISIDQGTPLDSEKPSSAGFMAQISDAKTGCLPQARELEGAPTMNQQTPNRRMGNVGGAALYVASGAAQVAGADITTYQVGSDGLVITEQTVLDRVADTGWGTQTTINGDGIHQQTEGAFIDTEAGIGGDGITYDASFHGPEHGDIEDSTAFGDCFSGVGNGLGNFFSDIGESVTSGISSVFSTLGGVAGGMRDAVTSIDLSVIGDGLSAGANAVATIVSGFFEVVGAGLDCLCGAVGAVASVFG